MGGCWWRCSKTKWILKYVAMKKRSEDVQRSVLDILETLKKVMGQARVQSLKELKQAVITHDSAKKTVVDNGGVRFLVLGGLSSVLGSFAQGGVLGAQVRPQALLLQSFCRMSGSILAVAGQD